MALLCASGLVVPRPALAADPDEAARIVEAEALLEQIAAQHEAADAKGLAASYEKLIPLHNHLENRSLRSKLQAAVGKVLADDDLNVAIRMDAADVLGGLYDEKGAYGQLKRFMPSPKDEAVGPLEMRVLVAVGTLAADTAISALVELATKGKDLNAARAALRGLGNYSYSKQRVRVLKEIVGHLNRLRPGGASNDRRGIGRDARARYDSLNGPMVAALNKLTGQDIQNADAWQAVYKENRKKPEKLFKHER